MKAFSSLFRHRSCNIIGMIHVPALPGTPGSLLSMPEILARVETEASQYSHCGVDGVIIENMHDTPYCLERDVGPEVTACMAAVGGCVRKILPQSVPLGIQILAGCNKSALAVALAAGLQFIRAEGFVFSHVADEGWIDASAGPLLRYRRSVGADHIAVFCDIKKKHSAHAVTEDVSIVETAHAAQFFRTDGVILTGSSTGDPASPQQLNQVLGAVKNTPVLIGSGITTENLNKFAESHGLIVGSYFKHGGNWENDIDTDKVIELVEEAKKYR